MIQVLQRAADIINYLSLKQEAKLSEIAAAIGVKFTTVCNIAKTMVQLGWLEKDGTQVRLGGGLARLALPEIRKNTLLLLAQDQVRLLAEKTGESVVMSMLYKNRKTNLADAYCNQEIAVNSIAFSKAPPYFGADLRVLLAYQDEASLNAYIKEYGLPQEYWPEASSLDGLRNELRRVREQGLAIRSSKSSDSMGLAAPVLGADGAIWAAVGINLPKSRWTATYKTFLINNLKEATERLEHLLSQRGQANARDQSSGTVGR